MRQPNPAAATPARPTQQPPASSTRVPASRTTRLAAVALAVVAGLLTAWHPSAHAAPKPKLADNGAHRRWYADHVTIVLDSSLAAMGQGATDAVRSAVGAWLQTDARLPKVSFVVDSAPAGRVEVDGVNRILAAPIDAKGHERDLAYASVSTSDAGEILEADIIINTSLAFEQLELAEPNGAGKVKSLQSAKAHCSSKYDLQNVATHEMGHFFGLGEDTEDPEATMYFKTGKCEVKKRTLETSDVGAVEVVYAQQAADSPSTAAGCSASRAHPMHGNASFAWLGVAVAAALARRRIQLKLRQAHGAQPAVTWPRSAVSSHD